MLRFKYLLLALSFAAATVAAQPPGPRPGGPLDIERLTILLDLDAYQKGEVERVLTEQRAAMREARQAAAASGERPSREEMHARREERQTALMSQLSNVLTAQQIKKLEVLMQPPRGARQGRRPGGE